MTRIGRIKRGSEQWLIRVYPPNPCYPRSIFTDDQEYAVALVSDVLAAVTEAGANAIYGINFAVAELGGVSLGDIAVISEVVGTPVMPLDMGIGGAVREDIASVPGISPGQLSYQVQVQVTYAIQ